MWSQVDQCRQLIVLLTADRGLFHQNFYFIMLDAAPKFWRNPPVTLDTSTATWIFSSLGSEHSCAFGSIFALLGHNLWNNCSRHP